MVQTPQRTQTEVTSDQVTPDQLVRAIAQWEAIVATWDSSQQAVVAELKGAIEALHREALTRLIRRVKQESMVALRHAVEDEVVYGLLRYHGLVKPPLSQRVQLALEEVRPSLKDHSGDVELVSIRLPDTVEVRFIGACSHCPASALTLSQGVEQSIKTHCPEILHVVAVSAIATPTSSSPLPEADQGWRLVTSLAEIPDGGVLDVKLEGHSLLLSRQGMDVTCFHNGCSHLGVPLHGGRVQAGVLTCPAHGFQFRLATGDCVTMADVPLQRYPVLVEAGQVFVQI